MNTHKSGTVFGLSSIVSLASFFLAISLGGCVYYPTDGIRAPNPGPTATPPWPYDPNVYPPGRSAPQGATRYPMTQPPSPIPNSQTLPMQQNSAASRPGTVAPPPSNSVAPQYADWLIDGAEGRGFAYYLSSGYRRYAKHEDNAHDFEDAAKFLFRAEMVERGELVEPEILSMRSLPPYAVDDLIYARQRLMATFNRGASFRLPKLSASAQINFDCWMEQQEENSQPHDIAQCRRGFEADIIRLETALTERVSCPTQPAPAPAPVCQSSAFVVFFDFNKHDLTSAGKEIVQNAITQAKNSGGATLVVGAHTDRAGSDAYNVALSKRRLDTVIAALEAAGTPADKLARSQYFGESQPHVDTPDGIANPDNRRVEIRLSCNAPAPVAQCSPQ